MTNKALSKSAQTIQDALSQHGLHFEVIEFSDSTRTAADAAKTIGCEVAQIVKSLVFRTKETHKPLLVLASGINRVNEQLLEREVGEKITKADADFIREITGFAIGGVPPMGHKTVLNTFIDEDLLKFETLWAAAGTPNAVFSLNSANIQSLTGGRVIAVK